MRKALSPLIAVTLLIVIAISIVTLIAPWMYDLVMSTMNETDTTTRQQVRCRNAGLDFDPNYAYYGVDWNFTGNGSDWIKVKLVNSKNLDLHSFSFEVTYDSSGGEEIRHYGVTSATAITETDPLRPGQSAIIQADMTEDINETELSLKSVKVLNSVCPDLSPSLLV